MKKSLLATALLATMVASTANAAPISAGFMQLADGAPAIPANTFTLGSGVYIPGYLQTAAANNSAFTTNTNGFASEFRMIGTDGGAGGGGEKSLVGVRDDGSNPDNNQNAINWVVGPHPLIPGSGIVLSTDGDMTPGAANSTLGPVVGGTTNAIFFNQFFGFGGANPWNIDVDFGTNKITIDTASIEAQWGGAFFPMGDSAAGNQCNTDGQGCGIHFEGDITNHVGNDFDFTLFGEHRVTPYEDTEGGTAAASGFAGWTAQFALQGSYSESAFAPVQIVPVPAAAWLFGSGLLGLVGVARRKKANA